MLSLYFAIPAIIILSILVIYAVLRLGYYIFAHQKMSFKEYPSSYLLKVLYALHTIGMLILFCFLSFTNMSKSNSVHLYYINLFFSDIMIFFVYRSLQTFFGFMHRIESCYNIHFYNYSIPGFLILSIFVVALDYSIDDNAKHAIKVISTAYYITFELFMFLLISFPLLQFLHEIRQHDISGERQKFFIYGYASLCISLIIFILIMLFYKVISSHVERLFVVWEPMFFILSLTQDRIDGLVDIMAPEVFSDSRSDISSFA